jgi:hypothetical protein
MKKRAAEKMRLFERQNRKPKYSAKLTLLVPGLLFLYKNK